MLKDWLEEVREGKKEKKTPRFRVLLGARCISLLSYLIFTTALRSIIGITHSFINKYLANMSQASF